MTMNALKLKPENNLHLIKYLKIGPCNVYNHIIFFAWSKTLQTPTLINIIYIIFFIILINIL